MSNIKSGISHHHPSILEEHCIGTLFLGSQVFGLSIDPDIVCNQPRRVCVFSLVNSKSQFLQKKDITNEKIKLQYRKAYSELVTALLVESEVSWKV
jgi:hypothetical protein